jgi:hypothetical protein
MRGLGALGAAAGRPRAWLHGDLARALLVGVAYYAGAWVGFATTFPATGISIVWPPNTVLLAALLVTPSPRTCWPTSRWGSRRPCC